MKTTVTESLRVWRRRAMAAALALLLAGGVLALTASAASADMACNYPPGSNTCLTIEPLGNGYYAVKVGIDVYMPYREAVAIIVNAPLAGFPVFIAQLLGDDGSRRTGLFSISCSARAFSEGGSTGVYGECWDVVPSSELNEDTEGRDEIIAQVVLVDCREGISCPLRRFDSGQVVGYW